MAGLDFDNSGKHIGKTKVFDKAKDDLRKQKMKIKYDMMHFLKK